MFFTDNYKHTDPNVVYIKESIIGPGVNKDDFYTYFKNTCSCSFNQICVDNRCFCISACGKNYISGNLIPDKFPHGPVFECSAFCNCSFDRCPNRVVQRGPNPRLEVRPAGSKGYGLFTLDTIPAGKFICEYAGELISKDVAAKRCRDASNTQYILSLQEHYGETLIETHVDAYRYSNIGRYINHSCSPNSVVIPARTGCVIPRAAIFTLKVVKANEEITYSYGEGVEYKGVGLSCYCEASVCKGKLPVHVS